MKGFVEKYSNKKEKYSMQLSTDNHKFKTSKCHPLHLHPKVIPISFKRLKSNSQLKNKKYLNGNCKVLLLEQA
jgi:hypothetical protein